MHVLVLLSQMAWKKLILAFDGCYSNLSSWETSIMNCGSWKLYSKNWPAFLAVPIKALAESPRACSIQAGDIHVSITERHGTILHSCRPPTVVWHAVHATFAVITDPSAGCPPVQLLETEPLPLLVLSCGTVCKQTLLRVTLSQFRRERKTFLFRQSYPDIFSFSSWSLRFLLRPR